MYIERIIGYVPKEEVKQSKSYYEVIDYYTSHGLTEDTIQAIGACTIPFDTLREYYGWKPEGHSRFALVFPHYDYQRQFVDWISARLVGKPVASFMDVVKKPKRANKMFCTPKDKTNGGPSMHAWVHPLCDWINVPDDGFDIDIHESVVKAALAHQLTDRYCIALNGVNSGVVNGQLVKELFDLPAKLVKRVRIIFDSDTNTNWRVLAAQNTIAAALINHGVPRVEIYNVPAPAPVEGEVAKRDLNDFWYEEGEATVKAWLLADDGVEAQPDGDLAEMYELNTLYTHVLNINRIYRHDNGNMWTPRDWTNDVEADRIGWGENAAGNPVEVSYPKRWMKWNQRSRVNNIVFDPTLDHFVEGSHVNKFDPSKLLEPKEGDIEPLFNMLRAQINDDVSLNFMLDCMAWNVQHMGDPPSTYLVLVSPKGRTGKTLLLEGLYKPIFGEYGQMLGAQDLGASWSPWMESLYVLSEEMFAGTKRDMKADYSKLKAISTAKMVTVKEKYKPQYNIRKCFWMAFTTNHYDSMYYDDNERRAHVVGFGAEHNHSELVEYVANVWLPEHGPRVFLWWLLQRDVSRFNPRADAPHTAGRALMQEMSRTPLEQFIYDLNEDWQSVIGPCPYRTAEEVMLALQNSNITPENNVPSKQRVGARLAVEFPRSNQLKLGKSDESPVRLYDLSRRLKTHAQFVENKAEIKELRTKYPVAGPSTKY